jgi:hypothetical protein
MAYQRGYDEEIARTAALACINDGEEGTYALSLESDETTTVDDVSPGIYRVFLGGMDGTKVVAITTTTAAEGGPITLPTPGTTPTPTDNPVGLFPGNVVERLRVFAGFGTVNARLVSGAGTLYLVQVVQLA